MFEGSWKIGQIMGIPIRLHFSWFVFFGLITLALAKGYFPHERPELPVTTYWLMGTIAASLLFMSVIIHELSHSFIAKKYNIPISSITLFIFGGVAQMKKEPASPKAEFNMAIAGPFSSYVLALIFFLLFKLFADYPVIKAIASYLFMMNLVLGTFNLIPGFPMDGGRVLRAWLWEKSGDYLSATRKASKAGQRIAIFFIFFGFITFFAGYAGGIWFILIGWFLYTAAQSSYQQATVRGILAGVKVRDVMASEVITVSSDISLSELVDNYFLVHGYGGFPVIDRGKLIGIISLKEIKEVPKDKWHDTSAKEVMQAFDDSLLLSEDDDVSKILERMIQEDKGRFVVLSNNKLIGLITRSGIAKYLQIKDELKG